MSLNGIKTIFSTPLTSTSSTDDEGVGVLRQEGTKTYRWVKNSQGAALTVGASVVYSIASGEEFYESVKLPVTADLNTLAGVCISAIPDGEYGWIQIEGYYASVSAQATSSQAAGLIMKPVNAVGYLVSDSLSSRGVRSEGTRLNSSHIPLSRMPSSA